MPLVETRQITKKELREKQHEAAKRWALSASDLEKRGAVKNISFSNPQASGAKPFLSIHLYPDLAIQSFTLMAQVFLRSALMSALVGLACFR